MSHTDANTQWITVSQVEWEQMRQERDDARASLDEANAKLVEARIDGATAMCADIVQRIKYAKLTTVPPPTPQMIAIIDALISGLPKIDPAQVIKDWL